MNPMGKRASTIESLVLAVHRRNGGSMEALDPSLRLLDPVLGIDSLDLAEIMAEIEKKWGVSPFNSSVPPVCWADVAALLESRE